MAWPVVTRSPTDALELGRRYWREVERSSGGVVRLRAAGEGLELRVLGVHGMAVRHYPALLDEIAAGRLDPARLVGATVPLERAGEELAAMTGYAQRGTTVITSF